LSDDNNNVDISLDEFEKEFYGQEEKPIEAVSEAEDDAENEDEVETEDDALETEQEDESEDEEEETPPEKPKAKKSAKERIDEITREKYELKRQLEEARRALESRSTEEKAPEPAPVREQLSKEAPNPDAKNDKGEPLYPLGEFDPLFIRDLTKFSVEQEMNAAKEAAQKEAAQKVELARQQELASSWNERLDRAEESNPEIRESIRDLVTVFEGIEPHYGDYLAATIMGLENGPDVMHYLSQNIGEAQKIVASGPAAATIEIGRLDARLSAPSVEKRNKKQSEAPPPPESRTRGQGGRFETPDDTDDLDAFEKKFFKPKRY
jgi:hypothetical protein